MRKIFLIFVLSIFWLVLSGIYDHKLLLVFGILSVAFTAFLAIHTGSADREGVPIQLFPNIITYFFWLSKQIAIANIAVMKEILSVKPNLAPQFIVVDYSSRSIMAHVLLANSITLTPGTVTVNVDEKKLLVHALNDEMANPEEISKMGDYVIKVSPGQNRIT